MKRLISLALLAYALAAPVSSRANAVNPSLFGLKSTIAVTGYAGSTELTDFPVLVTLADNAPSGFDYADCAADGSDLRFADAAGNLIPHEIEVWDTTGTSYVWVRVPSLSGTSTTFTLYFGARDANGLPAVDATSVWSRYAAVFHGGAAIVDATGNAASVVPGSVSCATAGGKVGGVMTKGNVTGLQYTNPLTSGALSDIGAFSVSGWFKKSGGTTAVLASNKGKDEWAKDGFVALVEGGTYFSVGVGINSAGAHQGTSGKGALTTGTWGYLAFSYNKAETTLHSYFDGVNIYSTSSAREIRDQGKTNWAFGGFFDGNKNCFQGSMDELRILNGTASADWIKAEYDSVANPAAFAVPGAVEANDSAAQEFNEPTIVRNANGTFTVTVVLAANNGAVGVIYDAGTSAVTNLLAASATPGTFTDTPSNLAVGTTYRFAAYGKNANGTEVVKEGGVFYNGDISVTKVSDANENGLVPGVFRISRADSAHDLPVSYTVGGTAVADQTYVALSGTATIPAGATYVDVAVTPINDLTVAEDVTVSISLVAGLYGVSSSAVTATMTIANLTTPAGFNTWIASAAGLASAHSNWSAGHAPTASENVLFDGRFSTADCEWDASASATVASWTQTNGYTGVITLDTVYPGKGDFQCLTVTGPMAIHSGTITHPQSRTMGENHPATWDWVGDLIANETYRLRLAVGSLTVGAAGLLDAKGKGYLTTHDSARVDASHGGRLTANSPRCYGDPKEPIHIGLPDRAGGNYYNGVGGGAIYVTSEGAIVVNGIVRADSDARQYSNNNHCCGAAGSVYLQAASVSGTGTISAYGPGSADGNNKGTGGRVAIVTEQPVDRSTFASINAGSDRRNAQNSRATRSGGSGTVFFKDASQTYGSLLVDNVDGSFAPAVNRSVTEPSTDGDWTFDSLGLGNRAILAIPVGTTLHLPGGLDSVFSLNSSGSTAYGSIRYEGGTLDLGSSTDQTMTGNWMLTPWTNLVLNTDVTVKGGAAIGVPAMADIVDNGASLPTFVSCNMTVNGDLTVESDGLLVAKQCGLKKDKNSLNNGFSGVLQGHTHGGRCLAYKYKGAQFYTGYDSVFAPCLPGNSVPWPNGQAAESSGGVLSFVVTGALTLDGEANVNGLLEAYKAGGNCSGGTGGSIDITAGTLSGSGKMLAEAGSKQAVRGSAGRIAVKLTSSGADFSNFTGTISASGRVLGSGGSADSSAGTVYLQTAADGDKGGTVTIAMSAGNQAANNTNTTEMVSLGYGGDAVADYKRVSYVIRDYGRAAVNTDFAARTVTIADANSSIDLEGNELTVTDFAYAETSGETPRIVRLPVGVYDWSALQGYAWAVDSSAEKTGRLVVHGSATVIVLH